MGGDVGRFLGFDVRDVPDYLAVDGAGDAVLQLEVHLWDGIFGEDGGVGDVTWWKSRMLAPLFLGGSRTAF